MRFQIAAMVLAATVAGCATGYQAKSLTGGFSETQLDSNVWTVSFKGNGYTSQERAIDFTLLRSADIARDHGYRYFIVVEKADQSTAGAFTTPSQSYTTAQATSSGNVATGTAHTTTYGGQTVVIRRPGISNTVVCFAERPANVDGLVYDVDIVRRSIREKYKLTD